MSKKKKTLPKNFSELIETGDISALKEVFEQCELNARGGYSKTTALGFFKIPDELVIWLVENGTDINARDNYQRTPLHHQGSSWCGNVQLFLDLGADLEGTDYQDETPLHAAAGAFKTEAVKKLVAYGANVNAESKMKRTPLAKALSSCRNIDIVNMADIAEILLGSGTPVTPEMKKSVTRIGQDFEFHREGFNQEYLSETEEALLRLYKQFDVVPVEKRKKHNGISPIEVTSKGWQAQHNELWKLLIPSRGPAKTIQGEVIRITGKVSYEILDNGGINWDSQYCKMLDALIHYFSLGTPLDNVTLQEATILVNQLRNGIGNDEPAKLCELAVHWVLTNTNPIVLEQLDYNR